MVSPAILMSLSLAWLALNLICATIEFGICGSDWLSDHVRPISDAIITKFRFNWNLSPKNELNFTMSHATEPWRWMPNSFVYSNEVCMKLGLIALLALNALILRAQRTSAAADYCFLCGATCKPFQSTTACCPSTTSSLEWRSQTISNQCLGQKSVLDPADKVWNIDLSSEWNI